MSSFYDFKQLSHDIAQSVEEDDHDHLHDPFTTLPTHDQYPMFYNFHPQVQATNNFNTDHHQEINIDHVMFHGSSAETKEDYQQKTNQWKSTKMRFTRKMMDPKPKKSIKQATNIPDRKRRLKQDLNSPSFAINTTNDGIVRVCSDCKTTKTPLWRSGPSGPKTLCNACGIRQRKARRAMAAAAAVNVGLIPASAKTMPSNNKSSYKKVVDASDRMIPFKKRCRFSTANNATTSNAQKKKLCLDDIVIRLSKSSAFHRVFPQDEKDAAILLMAISCGLMCS